MGLDRLHQFRRTRRMNRKISHVEQHNRHELEMLHTFKPVIYWGISNIEMSKRIFMYILLIIDLLPIENV